MSETPSNETLLEKISNLSDNMEKGFKITHEKQDHTNGDVNDLKAWREQVVGAGKAYKGIWGVLGVFAIAIVFGLFKMYTDFQVIQDQYIHLDDYIEMVLEGMIDIE